MTRRLQISPRAIDDLEQFAEWYTARGGMALGERFVAAVGATLEMLRRMPGAGRERAGMAGMILRAFRVHAFPDLLVVYRVVGRDLEVVRVLHGHRDLARMLVDPDEVRAATSQWQGRLLRA